MNLPRFEMPGTPKSELLYTRFGVPRPVKRRYFVNLDSTIEVEVDLPADAARGAEYDAVREAFIEALRGLLNNPHIESSDFDITFEDEA